MRSGIANFLAVAMALTHCGYLPLGVRIDSGDLAWLSYEIYKAFVRIAQFDQRFQKFVDFKIIASNDITVGVITTLMTQQHKINCFGVGTHLVTCKKEPALGGVYKLAQLDAKPKMKLSPSKTTIPCKKRVYRLYGNDGKAILDLMQLDDEPPPRSGEKVLCHHPFNKFKKAYVTPSRVYDLLQPVWKNGKRVSPSLPLEDVREEVKCSIQALRNDMVRFKNPTPYKVSLSEKLFKLMHQIWEDKTPAGELK
jgi:nicotinate phosphoribosyltransferase